MTPQAIAKAEVVTLFQSTVPRRRRTSKQISKCTVRERSGSELPLNPMLHSNGMMDLIPPFRTGLVVHLIFVQIVNLKTGVFGLLPQKRIG